MKTHWKQLINPDYIGAYSLPNGSDMNVTIISVSKEVVTCAGGKKEECTVAKLDGQKPFILNRTNCKMIQRITNTPYIEEWVNVTITLYAAVTKLKGEDVECLRIRESLPQLPNLDKNHAKWIGAKKALKDGSVTIDQIKQKFTLTSENEKEILS